jgi:predicted transcriptional regulator
MRKKLLRQKRRTPFTLRLDDDLRVRIARAAEKDGRTITGMMERLCSEALELREAKDAKN